uniref:Uncharacterized protein n=1 Tax=Ditylenchus dipsaci TaxID=166011 RepID=A0A915EW75_9BILA
MNDPILCAFGILYFGHIKDVKVKDCSMQVNLQVDLTRLLLRFSRRSNSFLPNLEANSIVALPFQKPPQPLVVWPATVPKQENLERPKTYDEKNFGQWCRNFTVNRHTQCPEASPFHWFVCCGEDGIECCGGIQPGPMLCSDLCFCQHMASTPSFFTLLLLAWQQHILHQTDQGDSNSCLSSLVVVVEDHSKEEHT